MNSTLLDIGGALLDIGRALLMSWVLVLFCFVSCCMWSHGSVTNKAMRALVQFCMVGIFGLLEWLIFSTGI